MAQYRNNGFGYNDDSYDSSAPQYPSNAATAAFASSPAGGVEGSAQSYDGYSPNEPGPFDLASIQLPPASGSCYQPPGDMKGTVRYVKHDDQNETKNVDQNLSDVKQIVRENVIHHQHNKNVLINVNRNHNHLIKVVNRDNNIHHHLINNIVRVNDIHRQKIEEVRGEGRTSKDYKQTHRVEAGGCRRADDGGSSGASYAAAAAIDDSASAGASAAAAWQAQASSAGAAYNSSANYSSNGSAAYGASYGSGGYGYAQQSNGARYGQYRQY